MISDGERSSILKAESGRLVNRTGFSGSSMFPKGASFGSLSEKPFQNCELVTPLPRMNVTIGVSNETSAGSMIPRDDLTGNAQTVLLKKPRRFGPQGRLGDSTDRWITGRLPVPMTNRYRQKKSRLDERFALISTSWPRFVVCRDGSRQSQSSN
jgi:hypothetical protein